MYRCGMRFQVRVEVWFEARSLEIAQEMTHAVQSAALDTIKPRAIRDPDSNAWAHSELEPLDAAARAALTADDLGPGISSSRFGDEP
jgi:hypothetical protein